MNEDFGGDIITISDEDGNEFDLELLDTIEFEGQTYCVFVPADIENMDVNDPDYGLISLKSREENGEELFDSVDDDDELDRVCTNITSRSWKRKKRRNKIFFLRCS